MTGAVLERVRGGAEDGTPRLLDEAEMKTLFNDYNNLLNAGVGAGFTMNYDRRQVVYTGGVPAAPASMFLSKAARLPSAILLTVVSENFMPALEPPTRRPVSCRVS